MENKLTNQGMNEIEKICFKHGIEREVAEKIVEIAQASVQPIFEKVEDITKVPSIRLIEELRTRKGIEVSSSGWGKKWDLTEKYTNNRDVKSDVLLIVQDLTEL